MFVVCAMHLIKIGNSSIPFYMIFSPYTWRLTATHDGDRFKRGREIANLNLVAIFGSSIAAADDDDDVADDYRNSCCQPIVLSFDFCLFIFFSLMHKLKI